MTPISTIFNNRPFTAIVAGCVVTLALIFTLLLLLLALSPPYDGLARLELQPARLFAPLYTYLFRNAVINTGWLVIGVYLLALPLGWTWAVTGVPPAMRFLLLLPLFVPGALVGLLWRPLFNPWLDLAQAELSLLVTGLVLLWQAVPLAAWLFSWDRDAWPKLIPMCMLLILINGDLVLTLTRGEPFNASHTWTSWLIQQLWVGRAWGQAASMAGALAVVFGVAAWWASTKTPSPIVIPHGSPLGLVTVLVWVIAPFVMPLITLVQAPLQAISTLWAVGVLRWLLIGALVWGGTTWLAVRFTWRITDARTRRLARVVTLTMLPITLVTVAYLCHLLPLLRNPLTLIGLTTLFTTGLLLGKEPPIISSRRAWLKPAGIAALIIAHSFPLQLVIQLPPLFWTPALGSVWTLAEASHAALALILLGYGVWSAVAAWMLAGAKPTVLTTEPSYLPPL